jgi:Helitron helicase-like domain at N-terminus
MTVWMEKTILFKDCRFAKDKMWCFVVLIFLSRHQNQSSGSFFVQFFYKQGPKNLSQLQKEISDGNLSWLNSIQYFSNRVTGSAAYWRARRNEVFSWINFHLEQKHGPPSFFITLSCAEYHWKDIERLIIDRCVKGGISIPDFSTRRAAIINEYTVVVQEYFQKRVQAWLDTVGKNVLKIKHHWLRFEFAPSRGQIHAHMLVICDNLEVLRQCHNLQSNKADLAKFLSKYLSDTLGMTACFNKDLSVPKANNSDTSSGKSMGFFFSWEKKKPIQHFAVCNFCIIWVFYGFFFLLGEKKTTEHFAVCNLCIIWFFYGFFFSWEKKTIYSNSKLFF